jgi:hypothetical protein
MGSRRPRRPGVADVRPIRDDVERRVRTLLTEVTLHPVVAVSGAWADLRRWSRTGSSGVWSFGVLAARWLYS